MIVTFLSALSAATLEAHPSFAPACRVSLEMEESAKVLHTDTKYTFVE